VQAAKLDPGLSQAISSLRQIIGMRNILVHGYAVVQNATVWGTVQNDLPVLRSQVDGLLVQPGAP
jgi:uncharacterized protein with HEPN domain